MHMPYDHMRKVTWERSLALPDGKITLINYASIYFEDVYCMQNVGHGYGQKMEIDPAVLDKHWCHIVSEVSAITDALNS